MVYSVCANLSAFALEWECGDLRTARYYYYLVSRYGMIITWTGVHQNIYIYFIPGLFFKVFAKGLIRYVVYDTLSLKDYKFTAFFYVFFGKIKVMIYKAVGTAYCTYPYSTYYYTTIFDYMLQYGVRIRMYTLFSVYIYTCS